MLALKDPLCKLRGTSSVLGFAEMCFHAHSLIPLGEFLQKCLGGCRNMTPVRIAGSFRASVLALSLCIPPAASAQP